MKRLFPFKLLKLTPVQGYSHCSCGRIHFMPPHDRPRWLKRLGRFQ